jgi:hypothetical protein
MSISITVDGKNYTMLEARKLYDELHILFGSKQTPNFTNVPNPYFLHTPSPIIGPGRWDGGVNVTCKSSILDQEVTKC